MTEQDPFFREEARNEAEVKFRFPRSLLERLDALSDKTDQPRNTVAIKFLEAGFALYEWVSANAGPLREVEQPNERIVQQLVRLLDEGLSAARQRPKKR